MKDIKLALVGFGNVAQGLVQILAQESEHYAQAYDLRFLITSISDPIKGTLFARDGVPPAELLAAMQAGGLSSLPYDHPEWDAMEMIQVSPADVLVELTYTNLQTGEPASTYIREALRRKKHVVTTNKGPIALHYDELTNLARINDVRLGVEGTVMSGTPTLRMGLHCMAPAGVTRVQGILNGTTNYILTQMEGGMSYAGALAEAQAQGFAEADPTGDVEGYDPAAKVAILARLVLGQPVHLNEVARQGITGLTVDDIQRAKAAGQHWKLIGTAECTPQGVKASVKPVCLPEDHPLAGIRGATNAITFSTTYLGDVTLIGPGAGRLQTGMAVIGDLLEIYQNA
jgi:homoserine dehydrogenase